MRLEILFPTGGSSLGHITNLKPDPLTLQGVIPGAPLAEQPFDYIVGVGHSYGGAAMMLTSKECPNTFDRVRRGEN